MEKNQYNQLELFSETNNTAKENSSCHNVFAGCLRGHEKAVILVICFILTSVISFTLGMEKGKRNAARAQNFRPDLADKLNEFATQGQSAKTPAPSQKQIITTPAKNISQPAESEENLSGYTIQLASYKSKTTAQKEAKKLQNSGHKTVVLSKGNYIIVCVGAFANKNIATTQLSKLKKTYHDSFVRRL